VVCDGRRCAALKVVSRETAAPDSFARMLELLDLLVRDTVATAPPVLIAAISATAAQAGGASHVPPASTPASASPQVDRARVYIEEHLSDSSLSVTAVATAIGSHPDYLAHVFSEQVGERMTKYIARERVKLARRLLTTTNWQVKRVAWACGFANPNWFSHVFHQHTGATPLDFRRAARQGP